MSACDIKWFSVYTGGCALSLAHNELGHAPAQDEWAQIIYLLYFHYLIKTNL